MDQQPFSSRKSKSLGVDVASEMTKIICLGDSHSKFFLQEPYGFKRMGIKTKRIRFTGKALKAASLAGFRPRQSTLDTKKTVTHALAKTDRLLLAFGQVDLELGYYYRKIAKGEQIDPEAYTDWLIAIYRDFLKSLDVTDKAVALKGVNLTVFCVRKFFTKYVARIVEKGQRSTPETVAALRKTVLSEAKQNKMHLLFNAKLADLADELNMAYFDINAEICRKDLVTGLPALEKGVAPEFLPGPFDHHLADSIVVRALHVHAAATAFELDHLLPKNWRL